MKITNTQRLKVIARARQVLLAVVLFCSPLISFYTVIDHRPSTIDHRPSTLAPSVTSSMKEQFSDSIKLGLFKITMLSTNPYTPPREWNFVS
ncbi:hypothetical protein N9F57_04035 [Gammaproteobacteria bacterium]|nr:hypothetical protein [Gammaproteobacteria bacterium]